MTSVKAAGQIAATPERVWAVITDARALVAADLGITAIEGDIAARARIALRADIAPKQTFRLRVATFDPPRIMVWQGGMPFGLFTGTRTFTLTPQAGGTYLHMREDFTGPLAGLIWKTMPDLSPSFTAFIDGVKHLAERSVS